MAAPDSIVGREAELSTIARFFDQPWQGARALLIEGEAGIGKTTLWNDAVRTARAHSRVLVSQASEGEVQFSFAVLTDLLYPAMADIGDVLPAPQRRALEAALLINDPDEGARLDARAVSLGTLGALRSLASLGPLTLAIDDVQWTDLPSARSLSFALRRLSAEPLALVAACRTSPGIREPVNIRKTMTEVERLEVGGMAPDALSRLLRRVGRVLPRPLALRIHEATHGNPFFALEIGRALDRQGAAPIAGEPLPLPEDLDALLVERMSALSTDAREVVLIAALSAAPTVELVESCGGSRPGLEEAARAGIVTHRGHAIAFTHPLLAATVYADAGPSERRDVHGRLARLVTDAEQRARHLALASSGPSSEVADALVEAAERARDRGATQVAADLCELAVAATPEDDPAARRRRVLLHAGNLFDAGDPPRAREILEAMASELPAGADRAQVLVMLSGFCWKDLGRVSDLLRQALSECADDDAHWRSEILSDLAWVGLDTCELVPAVTRARASMELAESANDAYELRRALSILALLQFLLGLTTDHLFDRAIQLQDTTSFGDLSSAATCLGRQLAWAGDLDAARRLLEAELARYRELGHETARYEILAHLADVEFRGGRFARAAELLAEAKEIAAESGVDVLGEILPVLAAVECAVGEPDAARRHATSGLEVCARTGDRWNEVRCRSVLGSLELILDNAEAAYGWLEPLPGLTEAMGLREPDVFPFVPDAVEALIGLGELEMAKELTERLEQEGRERGRRLATGTAARCQGLLAATLGDLSEAAERLETSLEELRAVVQPLELAKSLLVAGEIQRRMKKKRSTRELLGDALAIFEEIGARPWAEKARVAIARVGGRPPTSTDLTPSEEQVALLVADGHTNREVASSLFLSVHTVEANLKRIYRKLGVRSRTELARELGKHPHP